MTQKEKFLILADGEAPSPERLQALMRGRKVICLDGAAELMRRSKLKPSFILGDLDSISAATRNFFEKQKVPVLHFSSQDTTDLEKALHYCLAAGSDSIHLCGALGKRSDHSLANLSFLKKFHRKKHPISLFTETEQINFCQDENILLQLKKGARVALLGFPKARVSSRGLGYELQKYALELGKQESVSNNARKSEVRLQVKGAVLVIVEEK